MKNIQVIISVVFGVFILLGLFSFAGIMPKPGEDKLAQTKGSLTLWGTIPKADIEKTLSGKFVSAYKNINLTYVQKKPDTFANSVIEALAAGQGPDMIILPNDLIVRFSSKIEPFAPVTYPERQFLDTFIQVGEVFVEPGKDILALPFTVDPMVMYWNRDIFTNGNIVQPPKYWDEFLTLSPVLTQKTESRNILQSTVSFGEYGNVTHSKDILAMLMLQTGNSMIIRQSDGKYLPVFSGMAEKKMPAVDEVFRFYTDFSDPVNLVYSWNRSLSDSKDLFLAGKLAVYFGYASELSDLRKKNPNLNFDVALVPQVRGVANKTTFGRLNGLAVMKTSQSKPLASYVAQILASPEYSADFASSLKTPSPVRSVIAKGTTDPYLKIFYDSAVISKTWMDLRPELTDGIFERTVESIVSGREKVSSAVAKLQADFGVITQ